MLYRMYVTQNRPIEEIARWLKCSATRVSYWLDAYEIPKRSGKRMRVLTTHEKNLVKKLYHDDGLSQAQVSAKLRIPVSQVRLAMQELGVAPRRGKQRLTPKLPVRAVDHYEEVQYGESITGHPLMRTVAILECGHKTKVWTKKLPYVTEYTDHYGCRACYEREKENGSSEN